jgi:hypothetical protein
MRVAGTVLKILAVSLFSVASAWTQELRFPLEAQIESPRGGLVIRQAPPSTTAFRYELAPRLCGLANGSTVVALNQLSIANGEIWFQVIPREVTKYLGELCPAARPGWIAAKTTKGWLVAILNQDIEFHEEEDGRRLTREAVAVVEDELDTSAEARERVFLVDYILLALGSVLGVVIVAIERSRSLKFSSWPVGLVVFEAIVMTGATFVFCLLVKDQLYVAETASSATAILQVLEASPLGYGLLGFTLSVLYAKFVSFAKP